MIMIDIQNITREYGKTIAVNNLSLSIEKGSVLGLIGPNGAGKTTLLRMLATLLKPSSGNALISGHPLSDILEIRTKVGFLPDFFNLYNDMTIDDCFEFFGRIYGMDTEARKNRADEVIKTIGMHEKRKDLAMNLSRGMVQRLGLGLLMMQSPEIYILDEPASGLDPKSRVQLRNILRSLSQNGKTIIISSHILHEMTDFCTHIAIMDHGKLICSGTVEEIIKNINKNSRIKTVFLKSPETAESILLEKGAVILSASENSIEFETEHNPENIADILKHLVAGGICPVQYHEVKTNLEDVYLKITENLTEEL